MGRPNEIANAPGTPENSTCSVLGLRTTVFCLDIILITNAIYFNSLLFGLIKGFYHLIFNYVNIEGVFIYNIKNIKNKKKKKKKEMFFFFLFFFLLPDLYIFFFSLFKIYFDKEKFTYEKKYIHRLYIIDGLKKNCKEEKKKCDELFIFIYEFITKYIYKIVCFRRFNL